MNSNKRTALFIVIGAFIGFILGMTAALLFAATQLSAPTNSPNVKIETTAASIIDIAMTDTLTVTLAEVIVLTIACITIAYAITIPKKNVSYDSTESISIGSSSPKSPKSIRISDYDENDYKPITPHHPSSPSQ